MMSAALDVEWLKLRRSRVLWVSTTVLLLAPPALAAAFAAAAGRAGTNPMTLKARAMLPGPGWDGYLAALAQINASAGLLGMGIVVAWCFAREYAERTIVSLYANATSRGSIAGAKLALLTLWAVGIAIFLGPVALLIAFIAGLGLPTSAAHLGIGRIVVLTALTGLLALSVALFASLGRGYLPAIAGLLGMVVAAQVAVILGAGSWFPLSSPGLWAMEISGVLPIRTYQLVLVPAFSLAVAVVTVVCWRRASLA